MIVEQRPSLILIIGQKMRSVDVKTHAKRETRCPTRSVSNKLNCWGFDRCVIIYTSSASAKGICVKT